VNQKNNQALLPNSKFGGTDTPVSEPTAKGQDDDFDSPNKGVSRG